MCDKHPKLRGERFRYNDQCVACKLDLLYARRAKLKAQVFQAYGGKCKRCGIRDIDVLTLDHTNDDGNVTRRKLGGKCGASGIHFYLKLIREGFPKWLQILCANCNQKKKLQKDRRDRRYG